MNFNISIKNINANLRFVADYLNPLGIKQLTKIGFTHTVSINAKCNLFVTICSNLNTSYKTYLYEIKNQQQGVKALDVRQVAQILSKNHNKESLAVKNIEYFLNKGREETKVASPQIENQEVNQMYCAINNLLSLNLDSYFLSYLADESTLVQHLFKPPQVFTFQTSDNVKLYGMIYLPFNYEHGIQYPTVLYVYGGPKAQIVTNAYKSNKLDIFLKLFWISLHTRFLILSLDILDLMYLPCSAIAWLW